MISKSYAKFTAQNLSSGRQKMEGYDKSHFSGLNDEEKVSVYEYLKKEYIAPGVIEWMYYLYPEKTVDFLKDVDDLNDSVDHRVLISLDRFTDESKFLKKLFDNYNYFSGQYRNEILWHLYTSPIQDSDKLFYIESIIFTEESSDVLGTAADFFLILKGVSRKTKKQKLEFYRIREAIETSSMFDRKAIVNSIIESL